METKKRNASHTGRFFCAVLAAAALAPSLSAQPRPLALEDALRAALAGDPRVESADWDRLAAEAKAREAELRKIPSLSLAAGYTRLSDLSYSIDFGGSSIPVDSMDNSFSLSANLQYPVFAGFRLRESARLAAAQARSKGIAAEMTRRALVFEAQRAYWEAERATNNVHMLKENLTLAERSLEVARRQVENGTALQADLLTAEMRRNQADMDLGAALALQKRAYLTLESLVEGSPASLSPSPGTARLPASDEESALPYILTGVPGEVPDSRFTSLDEANLVARALENRPETRASSLAQSMADIGYKIVRAPLYPVLNLTGSFLYADPNPRMAFQTDPYLFTPTWNLGVTLSYDLGGLPANLASAEAQADALEKSRADDRRQRDMVALDVRACLLSFLQTKRDYALASGMIEQARESERVTEKRQAAGTASELDMLSARISRLRVEFTIANKLIDQQIAAADLERAAALAAVD